MTHGRSRYSRPVHVLVVDDDPEFLWLASLLLIAEGYDVTTAERAIVGLEVLTRRHGDRPVDLLVTDIHMPGMNGLELVCAARAQGVDVPTLVVSGHAAGEAAASPFMRTGTDEFLAKPFDSAVFLARVRAITLRGLDGAPH